MTDKRLLAHIGQSGTIHPGTCGTGALVVGAAHPAPAMAAARVLIVGKDDRFADRVRARGAEVVVLDAQAPLADRRLRGSDTRHARTTLPSHPWDCPVPWFLATFTMPDRPTVVGLADAAGIRIKTRDGAKSLALPGTTARSARAGRPRSGRCSPTRTGPGRTRANPAGTASGSL